MANVQNRPNSHVYCKTPWPGTLRLSCSWVSCAWTAVLVSKFTWNRTLQIETHFTDSIGLTHIFERKEQHCPIRTSLKLIAPSFCVFQRLFLKYSLQTAKKRSRTDFNYFPHNQATSANPSINRLAFTASLFVSSFIAITAIHHSLHAKAVIFSVEFSINGFSRTSTGSLGHPFFGSSTDCPVRVYGCPQDIRMTSWLYLDVARRWLAVCYRRFGTTYRFCLRWSSNWRRHPSWTYWTASESEHIYR